MYLILFLILAVFVLIPNMISNKLDDVERHHMAEQTRLAEEIGKKRIEAQKGYPHFKELSILGTCDLCGKKDVSVAYCKFKNKKGTFYRKVCLDCFKAVDGDLVEERLYQQHNPKNAKF